MHPFVPLAELAGDRLRLPLNREGRSLGPLRKGVSTYQCWIPNPSGGDDPTQRLARLVNPLRRALDSGSNALRVGDVHCKELGPRRPAQLLHQLGARILVEVEDRDVAALLVELNGCCAAEAGCPVVVDVLAGVDVQVSQGASVLHVIGPLMVPDLSKLAGNQGWLMKTHPPDITNVRPDIFIVRTVLWVG